MAEEREELAEAHQAFVLEKAEAEEQQRLAAEDLSRREGELRQRKVDLDSHEDDLTAREQSLGGALQEARDAAAAAETAKRDLEARVAQLEINLRTSEEKVAALTLEREKDAHSHSELQVRLSDKGKELAIAKDSVADLELKLSTLTESLDSARNWETKLKEDLRVERALLDSAALTQNNFRQTVEQ